VLTCEVCGHKNAHRGAYCEACGAKLPGRVVGGHAVSSTNQKKKPIPLRKNQSEKKQAPRLKLESWHYVVGAFILGLVGVFVYIELQRDYPTNVAQQQPSAPMRFPASQTPSTSPTKEILDAIVRLEKTVKDNPNDAGAKLLLANALHDGAMHDGSMFPRAIEAYKKYLNVKPGDPNARIDLGICYFELGKIDSMQSANLFSMAISEMELTMKSNPKHQAGAFNLGIVYLWTGNMQESNRWLKKAVGLNAESDLGKRAKAILEQHNQAG
jgi:cytochrome c-type biogenesis protein CcmH/NrfG